MIARLEVTDPTQTPVPWWPSVFPSPRHWDFQPGLNILFGRNGSGKSTLLTALARLTLSEEAGFPLLTQKAISHFGGGLFQGFMGEPPVKEGMGLVSDGTYAHYYDSNHEPGSSAGGLDYNAISSDPSLLLRMMERQSTGNTAVDLIMRAFQKPKSLGLDTMRGFNGNYHFRGNMGDHAENLIRLIEKINTPTPGLTLRPTVLLDEPDRSLDIPSQVWVWTKLFSGKARTRQIIIATHSPLVLMLPLKVKANFIELTPGYIGECREALMSYGKRS